MSAPPTEKELAAIAQAYPLVKIEVVRRLIINLRAARAALRKALLKNPFALTADEIRAALPPGPQKKKCGRCGTPCDADEEGNGCACPTWCYDVASGVHADAALPPEAEP